MSTIQSCSVGPFENVLSHLLLKKIINEIYGYSEDNNRICITIVVPV
jgi:hypothetical protein